MFREFESKALQNWLLKLSLWSKVLPYFSHTHTWILMMLELCHKSRELWLKNFEIFVKIILKDNKINLPINYFSIKGLGSGLNFAMFNFNVTTSTSEQLEHLVQLPDRIFYSELLWIEPEEWNISTDNMKSFISLLRRNPGHNLSKIRVKINQDWFKKPEDATALNSLRDLNTPFQMDLVLKHNEMVFPNVSLYKTIIQNSSLNFEKLSTNISLVELLRKAKVMPSNFLSVSRIEFECLSSKRNQKYSIPECVRYLLEIFPSSHELIINWDTANEGKCLETIQNLSKEERWSLQNIKLVLQEASPGRKVRTNFTINSEQIKSSEIYEVSYGIE